MNLARFGVTRPVPVNLLMTATIIGGVYAAVTITREFFPDITPNMATVTLPYPGASPEEVEEGLAIKVEDAIADLDEVKEIRTTLTEGGGGIIIEFHTGVDIEKAVDEVERAVDSLLDLPDEAETIQVVELEPQLPVIMVTLYGGGAGVSPASGPEARAPPSELELKQGIRRVRDELKTLPSMGDIVITGVREYEIRVDVKYESLLEHGVSLPQVAEAIRAWMREVPGGTVRTETGNISVRTLGVPEKAQAIRDIVVIAASGGPAIRVSDIAVVREDFVDQELIRRFNGQPSVSLIVLKTGDQDAVAMAKMVRAYVVGRRGEPFPGNQFENITTRGMKQAYDLGRTSPYPLPGSIDTHSDLARFIEGRLNLLSRNAFWGAILVFATLFFFLNWRVAVWVGLGLVTALCGTILVMKMTGVTLNLLTMFGMIVVLGLLVDDAIVVAENIQHRHDAGEPALVAAINGTTQVFWPVVATVVTTVVAFLPLSFIAGQIGDLLDALPLVVACALGMSLMESVLILPSHMGHSLKRRDRKEPHSKAPARMLHRFESWRDSLIRDRITPAFGRFLNISLKFRYISAATALAIFIGTLGLLLGGRLPFSFLGESDSETIIVDVRMPIGVPMQETERVVKAIEEHALAQNTGEAHDVKSVSAMIGQRQDLETNMTDISASHVAQIYIELTPIEKRSSESSQVIAAIREATVGRVELAESIKYSEIQGGPGGADLNFELTGENLARLEAASNSLQAELRQVPGVFDVADDNYAGQREIQITLKPGASPLGLTSQNVASQVRGALFGIDAHVFSAQREDIDVRVRLAEETRRSLYRIENLWLISPAGQPVPLKEVAEVTEGSGYASIKRVDRERAITVTADTAPGLSPEEILRDFMTTLNSLRDEYPQVEIRLAGRQRDMMEAFATLPYGFAAALLMIYVILAWLFSSYSQPLAVMLAIPFGVIGVFWGHWLLGFDLTFLSLIGFVALSGIVVNDSLILIEYYNHRRAEGETVRQALVNAGMRRLRPIFLTTITTILGLTPLMLEQSFQARFLIPMAISISFGLLSATLIILMVLPCFIVIIEDLKSVAYYVWFGRRKPPLAAAPGAPVVAAE